MMIFEALKLMRLHRPVGIFLLWWPTAWALWIANLQRIKWSLVIWFAMGTLLMRSAGCVINDIADRRFDLHVKRTADRPLTAGTLSLPVAWGILFALLLMALIVLIQLPPVCFYYALLSLFLFFLYPFCKRFLKTPQGVLALAFSMGIPMVYAASDHVFDLSMWTLMLINISWVLAYDTIYACMDKADDRRIGIYSTALYWGTMTPKMILGLHCFIQGLWLLLAILCQLPLFFGVAWILGGYHFLKQYLLCRDEEGSPKVYFQAFNLNAWYGFWMWCGLCISSP